MAILVENRKARADYEILEKFEAGLKLHGFEVKALRGGRGSLPGSHVIIRGGEAYLLNMDIPPYQAGNTPKGYDPKRTRKLLLSKKEINELNGYDSKKGLTIVPFSVYSKGRFLKLSFAVVRGKKKYDKREDIKKRETDREIRRSLKRE
jgi:SsrA-binding protein